MDPPQEEPSQGGSQASQERIWKLSGGEMEVVSARRKKSGDNHMTLELKFTLVGDSRPRIIGKIWFLQFIIVTIYHFIEFPYTEQSLKNSLIICSNALGK